LPACHLGEEHLAAAAAWQQCQTAGALPLLLQQWQSQCSPLHALLLHQLEAASTAVKGYSHESHPSLLLLLRVWLLGLPR
jgi:hypothetical protein